MIGSKIKKTFIILWIIQRLNKDWGEIKKKNDRQTAKNNKTKEGIKKKSPSKRKKNQANLLNLI